MAPGKKPFAGKKAAPFKSGGGGRKPDSPKKADGTQKKTPPKGK